MLTRNANITSSSTAEHLKSWTFDPSRTEAGFHARRMGTTWVDGRFKDVHGHFYFDVDEPLNSSCVGEIDVAKLHPGEPYLNTQLRTDDFLGVEDHPRITFAARLADRTSDIDFTAEVLLTLRGITQRVPMDLTYLGQWEAPLWTDGEEQGAATRMGFRAEGVIAGHLANAIEISLDIEAILDTDLDTVAAARALALDTTR
jgi:polyisoprenoid-binding protein YceI